MASERMAQEPVRDRHTAGPLSHRPPAEAAGTDHATEAGREPTALPAGRYGTGEVSVPAPRARWDGTDAPQPPPRPLDDIDRAILQILQADGRASIRSVAERVHVSRANAYTRINRLAEDGVIRGFSARIDHERAGQGAAAYVTLKIVQNSWRTVREQLAGLPGASHIALVSGDFDVLLLVHSPDNRALRELVLTRLQSIPEVLSTRTLLVFEEDDLESDL